MQLSRLREWRERRGLTQQELAEQAEVARDSVSKWEIGHRGAYPGTARKLADALGVGIEDLTVYPKAPSPSLEDLHAAAGFTTSWLVMPEEEWQRSWGLELSPREALRIVREISAEFVTLKPLMTSQEDGLPRSKKAFRGQYKQAWRRFFDGLQAAHSCGVAKGLITPGETLNDLARKLGDKSEEPLEEPLLAG